MMSPDVVQVLVDRHREFLSFLEPRVGSRAAAEELLQTAFVKGLERGGDIRDGESAVAWFYRLLRNALVDFYRHRDVERRALEREAAETPPWGDPDVGLEHAVCQCVHGLIPTLKADQAELLQAVEIDGRSIGEVAGRLGISAGNAAVRLHRARRALKGQLEVACGTCAEHACLDCTCGKPSK
jgi:RNA polymerase sigma-70 factor (ECF subfamily)